MIGHTTGNIISQKNLPILRSSNPVNSPISVGTAEISLWAKSGFLKNKVTMSGGTNAKESVGGRMLLQNLRGWLNALKHIQWLAMHLQKSRSCKLDKSPSSDGMERIALSSINYWFEQVYEMRETNRNQWISSCCKYKSEFIIFTHRDQVFVKMSEVQSRLELM